MILIDGDYPMAPIAIDRNRDLTRPIEEVRAAEAESDNIVMASLPEMRRGRIAAALVKVAGRIQRPRSPLRGYRSGELAYASAQGQLAYYRVLEARGEARILKTRADLRPHLQQCMEAVQWERQPVGFVLGMEGADPILWPEQVHEWFAQGVRVVSLAHYGVSTYAHGTGTPGGLLPPAKPLLREMEAAGMILDLTHTSDEGFWQALELFSGPVLASHQNCRALVPGERQFSDDQLKTLLQRGAVIGASMDTWMLYPEGRPDWGTTQWPNRRSRFPREAVTLEHVVNHIDHVCQLAGDAHHAAIGGDTDGQGGREGAPHEIDTVADYQKLIPVLERRGYASGDIAGVMYGNWQRFFEAWLP